MKTGETLLRIEALRTHFQGDEGVARAVDGVDLQLAAGETLGLVGESGSGKTVTALSVLGLVPCPPGIRAGGRILFRGEDLLELPEERMRKIRGNEISMIFQEPMTALNPVFTVGEQIAETVRLHEGLRRNEAWARAARMLEKVGIPEAARRVGDYPHQLSGGMRQRVMIAMAMSCHPALLIADEATTALDVTIQAQVLELISQLQEEEGMSVLLITHDLGVVAAMADRVAVMYAGRVVEHGSVASIFEAPAHPYTIGLLRSLPELASPGERLATIEGVVPSAFRFPSGCRFHPRCPLATEACENVEPPLESLADDREHTAACLRLEAALGFRAGGTRP